MPQPLTSDDLYRFRWVDHVRLDPAGRRIAYQLTWPDAAARENRGRIYVRDLVPEAEAVELASTARRDHSPAWSPDGRRLAYVSHRGAKDNLFVVDAAGGEARRLTSVGESISGPRFSRAGDQVAFLARVLTDPAGVVDDTRPPQSDDESRRSPVARVARRLDYKADGPGFSDGRSDQLFVISAEGGEPSQLTSGPAPVESFSWAPDNRLAVAGDFDADSDLRLTSNLYVVELDGSLRLLVRGLLQLGFPSWSPRGDLIAFVAAHGREGGLNERLWVVPAEGGRPRCLTLDFDLSVGDGVITDMRGGHGTRVVWSEDGERIHFLASGPGRTGLFSVDLDGRVRQLVGGERQLFDFDARSGQVVFGAADPSSPGDLYLAAPEGEVRLSRLNAWLDDCYVAQPERVASVAPDRLPIEGWLLKPPDFDPSLRYPLVMEVHGGPHGQYGWSFFHEFQILAGLGFLVFYVNPRGSNGYGEAFQKAVVRDWGGKDYLDLMSALDQLIERGFVDESRMGIGGGSYGGYMTNWIIGHTDRFAAAIAMRSLSNLVSEYAQHDIVPWGGLELGPPPWPSPDELWQRSPIRYVDNIRTPLLLTHGEMDLRCAISQAEELFGALRLLGREVEMVRFPGESHDLSRSGRPDRRVERLNRIAGWFQRYLMRSEARTQLASGAAAAD